jgi:hypothetical protein
MGRPREQRRINERLRTNERKKGNGKTEVGIINERGRSNGKKGTREEESSEEIGEIRQ